MNNIRYRKAQIVKDFTDVEKSKFVACNVVKIQYKDGTKVIRYIDTDILTFKNGTITLNAGEWFTRTTKKQMNKFLPKNYYVFQKKYKWYLYDFDTRQKNEYYNGIVINLNKLDEQQEGVI